MRFLQAHLDWTNFRRSISQYMDLDNRALHHHNIQEQDMPALVAGLTTIGWPDESNFWQWREELRLHYNTYNRPVPPRIVRWIMGQGGPDITKHPYYALASPEPNKVNIVPDHNQRRARDTREDMRWARFAQSMLGFNENQARELANMAVLGEFTLQYVSNDAEAIIDIYERGPDSCMVTRGHRRSWSFQNHPVRAYASPDIRLAFLTRNENDIVGRCLVTNNNEAVRCYGDATKMRQALEADGISFARVGQAYQYQPVLEGQRLDYLPVQIQSGLDHNHIVAPFLDSAAAALVYFEDEDGEWVTPMTDSENTPLRLQAPAGRKGFKKGYTTGGTGGVASLLFDDTPHFHVPRTGAEVRRVRTLMEEYGLIKTYFASRFFGTTDLRTTHMENFEPEATEGSRPYLVPIAQALAFGFEHLGDESFEDPHQTGICSLPFGWDADTMNSNDPLFTVVHMSQFLEGTETVTRLPTYGMGITPLHYLEGDELCRAPVSQVTETAWARVTELTRGMVFQNTRTLIEALRDRATSSRIVLPLPEMRRQSVYSADIMSGVISSTYNSNSSHIPLASSILAESYLKGTGAVVQDELNIDMLAEAIMTNPVTQISMLVKFSMFSAACLVLEEAELISLMNYPVSPCRYQSFSLAQQGDENVVRNIRGRRAINRVVPPVIGNRPLTNIRTTIQVPDLRRQATVRI